MGQLGLGKISEGILVSVAFPAAQIAAATVYYNGKSITFGSGIGFDTQNYDDCMVGINIGVVQGALATLLNTVMESDTDDPTAATAISLATFSVRAASATTAQECGRVQCKDTKRFLFLKTEAQGAPLTIQFGAMWIAGTPRSQPTPQKLVFDV
jgi:hypothetical protein